MNFFGKLSNAFHIHLGKTRKKSIPAHLKGIFRRRGTGCNALSEDCAEPVVVLAGNPNVGKSTVFNRLTGLRQHTGNWAGKTVETAEGFFRYGGRRFRVVDIPGMYSYTPRSAEEDAALKFLLSGSADAVVVVCDAGCLRRGIAFALETAELTRSIIICVNLTDEAERRGIHVDTRRLSKILGMPVIPASAAHGKGMRELEECIAGECSKVKPPARSGISAPEEQKPCDAACAASRRILTADAVCEQCVVRDKANSRSKLDMKLDRIFTGRITGRVCMLMLLCAVFWLTIIGANYPSEWLAEIFSRLEHPLRQRLDFFSTPEFIKNMLVEGVYRVMTKIISVMLPPMAIFFPLFTLLEDSGYLPRAAFNLDSCLHKCGTCGKQALTSCMGFGCNAVGVTGCRIIDSPRERIIATVTNSFIPCNGRFPILTALISMFFLGSAAPPFDSVLGAMMLTGLICLGLAASFGVSKLLSVTLLRGTPSSFALELPPYRKPRFLSVIIRSALDRTIFVLGRAAAVAAPAGALIWITANIRIGGASLLNIICQFLDPLGSLLGMDGVILTAFILGFPANETVIPLMIMAYMAHGSITGSNDTAAIRSLLLDNGWNVSTAVCVMLFTLMHWPCATTCVTIYRETKSLKWTALSIIIPTLTGCVVCAFAAAVMRALGIQ